MKDAKGHGSEPHGGAVGVGLQHGLPMEHGQGGYCPACVQAKADVQRTLDEARYQADTGSRIRSWLAEQRARGWPQ